MNTGKIKPELSKRRSITAVAAAVLLLVVVLIVIVQSAKPSRSVEAFCNTFKQEDARLAKSYGDTYSVHPFTHTSNNPHDFVIAFSSLEAVAPKEIEPDVKTLRQIFEKIDKDPSQALSASLSGLGAESSVADWTSQHCQ